MKKIFAILSVFAVVIGCQKPEMDQPAETGVQVPLKITADIAQTKTTMTNDNGVLKSAWKDGDKIYVQPCQTNALYNTSTALTYTVTISDDSILFNSTDALSKPDDVTNFWLYAEYPKALGGTTTNLRTFSMSDAQTQSAPGDLSHIAEANMLFALPVQPDWNGDEFSAHFDFQHALSVLQLDLKGAEEGITITTLKLEMLDESGTDFLVITNGVINEWGRTSEEAGTITMNAGKNLLTLNIASPAILPTDEYAQFYMTISPGHAGQTFKVTALTDTGKTIEVGTMKVPATSSIPQGAKAYKAFTVNPPVEEEVDWASAIDLSADGTANCYVVNKANQLYKFKATVKGNAAVPASLSESGIATEIAPKTALELWYAPLTESNVWTDKNPILLESVTLKDEYIYFSTPEEFVDGNVVIAAFAEEGLTYSNITADATTRVLTSATVLWSWNLWCVEGYEPENEVKEVGGYTIMNRNLGALINGLDVDVNVANDCYRASYAVGNHYQMGRKDPMPSHFGYNSYLASYCQDWTPNFTPIVALQQTGSVMYNEGTGFINSFVNTSKQTLTDALDCATELPYLFMSGATTSPFTYSWYPYESGNYSKDLWCDLTTTASDEVKTMFDPCPEGWMVWTSNAADALWDSCAELNQEVRGNGVYVGDDICFPFTSARIASDGSGAMEGNITIYQKWGTTGAGNMTGDVLVGYLTSTNNVYSNTSPYIYDVNILVNSVSGAQPTITFNKYAYYNKGSLGHQRAARPVRCMKVSE